MIFIKSILIISTVALCTYLGFLYSKKYVNRVRQLEIFKAALNLLETKIQFTYKPLSDIFCEIADENKNVIGEFFKKAALNLQKQNAVNAWECAIKNSSNNLLEEDKQVILELGKVLGKTDVKRTSSSN